MHQLTLIGGGVAAAAFGATLWCMLRDRCPSTCWILRHDTMPRRVYDRNRAKADATPVPHVLDWECRRCDRIVGRTDLPPAWPMLARLRRQAYGQRAVRGRRAS